jgi:photosystem II stability/assembly factor-like uncharacterized protein
LTIKRYILFACTVMTLFIAGLPLSAAGALIQLSANTGEIPDLLRIDTNVLIAATQGGGIYKSADSGASWSRLASFGERYVWKLAGHPASTALIYAATSKGLFKSTDAGTSWSQLTFDSVSAVSVDPFNQNHVLIGVPGAGIYNSMNGGDSFTLSNTGIDSLDVTALAFDPGTSGVVYTGLYSNGGGGWGGVFKSTDGGNSWMNWNNPGGSGALTNKFVTTLVVDDEGSIHAGTLDPNTYLGGLYKQIGNGGWSLRREVYGVETLSIDRSTSHGVWAGSTSFGPWKTSDNGGTWNQAVNPLLNPDVYSGIYAVQTFSGSPGKVLVGVKGLGLYVTLNGGGSWTLASNGLTADRARAIAAYPPINPTILYLGLAGGGVMRSINSGTSWGQFNTGLEVPGVETNLTVSHLGMSSTNANTLYAATSGRGLFRWNGSSWTRVAESGLYNPSTVFLKPTGLAVDPGDDRFVYYALFDPSNGVYKRALSGTWSSSLLSTATFPGGARPSRLVMSPGSSSRLYALLFDDLPFRTTNGGATWTQVSATHPGFMRLSFFAIAENSLNAGYVLASTNKGLFQSTDNGITWTGITVSGELGSTVLTGLVFSPSVNGRVWGVDRSGGFYCSNDSGSTWNRITTLPSAVQDLQIISGALYLITDGSGVYREPAPTCP